MQSPKLPQDFQFTFVGPQVPRTTEDLYRFRDPVTGKLTDNIATQMTYQEVCEPVSSLSSCSTSPSYSVSSTYEWIDGERYLVQREKWEWVDGNPFPVNGHVPPPPQQTKPPASGLAQLKPPAM